MTTSILAWSPFDPWHLLVIMVVALLLFGKRLPDVGRSLGRGISEFKKGLKDVHDELNNSDSDRTAESKREPDKIAQHEAKRFPEPKPPVAAAAAAPDDQREGRPH